MPVSRRSTHHLHRRGGPRAALAATLVATLSAVGAVTASPAQAAARDGVIAWVEVEDGALTGNPGFSQGDHSNFSGTGFHTFRDNAMSSTMQVTAPAAGTYPVHVRYAAGPLSEAENIERSMGLVTNGVRQQMRLPYTGEWEKWAFVTYDVTLVQGANTVALRCDGGVNGGASPDFCRLNFDAIQVGGAVPDPCDARPVTPGYATALYDGTFASLDGWRHVGDDGFGRQDLDCTLRTLRGRGAQWYSTQQAGPYTLRLDWRRQAGDDESSVYVASSSNSGVDPAGGFRIPIGTGTGSIVPPSGSTKPADQAAVTAALRPVGEWNTYAITVGPTDIAVYLNGTLVNTFRSPTILPAQGYVGLENRGAGQDVSFRDIQVKRSARERPTTSVTVAPGTVRTGQGASVSVRVAAPDRTPTGEVEIYVDGVRSSTVTLTNGSATADIGPFPTAGPRSIEAIYLGDIGNEPSQSAVSPLAVGATPGVVAPPPAPQAQKVTPTMSVEARPKQVVSGRTKARVAVSLSAATASGQVVLEAGGNTYSRTLVDGKVTFVLAKQRKAGRIKVRATYAGDATTNPVSRTTRIRVVARGR